MNYDSWVITVTDMYGCIHRVKYVPSLVVSCKTKRTSLAFRLWVYFYSGKAIDCVKLIVRHRWPARDLKFNILIDKDEAVRFFEKVSSVGIKVIADE